MIIYPCLSMPDISILLLLVDLLPPSTLVGAFRTTLNSFEMLLRVIRFVYSFYPFKSSAFPALSLYA